MTSDEIMPGWPGRGFDPTERFTDLQWYMFHQRNVAYFAAFSRDDLDTRKLVETARELLTQAPQFGLGCRGDGLTLPDTALARLGSIETVPDFTGLPDRWLSIADGLRVYGDPGLPFFRLRAARLVSGPDALGRRSFLLVQVAHPLTEGADSALLARSHSAAHAETLPVAGLPARIAGPARLVGTLAAVMHVLVARIVTPHPGTIVPATRVYPRAHFSTLARRLGTSQRALFLALVAHVICGSGAPGAKPRVTGTYSTLQPGGRASRDPFMRMRMLLARFDNHDDFPSFARGVDARLAREGTKSGFNEEMNAAAIATHRRVARLMPRLYAPKVFDFMPYDFVFALLPPHRLGGGLTSGMLEPVYAGAPVPGMNGGVVVPGREWVSFNFFLQEKLRPNLDRLDRVIESLSLSHGS